MVLYYKCMILGLYNKHISMVLYYKYVVLGLYNNIFLWYSTINVWF